MKTVTTFQQLVDFIGISLEDFGYDSVGTDELTNCEYLREIAEELKDEVKLILI